MPEALLTRKQLAKAVGLTPEALRKWERDYRAPLTDWLAWPLDDAKRLAQAWRLETFGDTSGTPRERLIEAQIRRTNAQARAEELDVAEREGRLIDRAEVERDLAVILATLRADLEALPDAVIAEVPDEFRAGVYEQTRHRVVLALRRMRGHVIDAVKSPASLEDLVLAHAATIKRERAADAE